MSLNVPAVMVLDRIGPLRFSLALAKPARVSPIPTRGTPSLPIALGGLGISLADITMLYAGIAEGGAARPLRLCRHRDYRDAAPIDGRPRRLVSARYLGRRVAARRLGEGRASAQTHHRIQDRHVLRLPRCVVGRIFERLHGRRVGRPRRRRAERGPHRPRSRSADPAQDIRAAAGRTPGWRAPPSDALLEFEATKDCHRHCVISRGRSRITARAANRRRASLSRRRHVDGDRAVGPDGIRDKDERAIYSR